MRLLTKKVVDGLPDRVMARRLQKGMAAARNGNQRDILNALLEDEESEANEEQLVVVCKISNKIHIDYV